LRPERSRRFESRNSFDFSHLFRGTSNWTGRRAITLKTVGFGVFLVLTIGGIRIAGIANAPATIVDERHPISCD
jgi:hypothetical protein